MNITQRGVTTAMSSAALEEAKSVVTAGTPSPLPTAMLLSYSARSRHRSCAHSVCHENTYSTVNSSHID